MQKVGLDVLTVLDAVQFHGLHKCRKLVLMSLLVPAMRTFVIKSSGWTWCKAVLNNLVTLNGIWPMAEMRVSRIHRRCRLENNVQCTFACLILQHVANIQSERSSTTAGLRCTVPWDKRNGQPWWCIPSDKSHYIRTFNPPLGNLSCEDGDLEYLHKRVLMQSVKLTPTLWTYWIRFQRPKLKI